MKRNFTRLLLSSVLMMCCMVINAAIEPSEPQTDGNGNYKLSTAAELYWFANYVNSGNSSANAILTADITVNTGVLDTDGRPNSGPFETWTPIGKPGTDFEGEFDGDGHTISGLYLYNIEENDVGVFGKAINDAYIHDLGIKDSYFYGGSWVGGICGDFASGRIENCWSAATVRAHGNDAGGICGSCWKFASVANCYNIGDVSLHQIKGGGIKTKFGGICGTVTYNENAISIDNCYTLKHHSGEGPYAGLPYVDPDCDKIYGVLDGDAEVRDSYVKDAAAFVGGEVCYFLNHGMTDGNQKWYQTLGSDLSPVIDNSHETVYYGYHGDVLEYSNTQPDAPAHIVSYVDADGQEQTAVAVEITNGTSRLNAGWYVVTGDNVSTGTLTSNGAVNIILADGAKLTASGSGTEYTPGIQVSGEGNSLTIYGQTAQSGQLTATGGKYGAGIGGGNECSGSNITINGGVVTATGGASAAGIGGGSYGSGSNITINGGTVTANGGVNNEQNSGSAGIGGGSYGSGSNITINGGVVTANGWGWAAGIGGAMSKGYGTHITINGGTVTATGGQYGWGCAAGIGDGDGTTGSYIFVATELTIRADNSNPPATVIAADRTATTDIASYLTGRYVTIRIPQPGIVTYGDYITVSPQFASGDRVDIGTEITFTADDRWADNYEFLGFYKESTFENKITTGVSGLTYTVKAFEMDISVYAKYKRFTSTPYIDADGQERTANAAKITNETSTLNAGWYVVYGNDVRTGTLTCNGAVHLILADGAKLTATGVWAEVPGIMVSGGGNSLTIYGQTAQSGQLIAKGGDEGAGIGGGYLGSGSNITINGGTVTATGGAGAAGIGGGKNRSGSNITINDGTVTATGGNHGAGIGGGNEGSGSNITINGGTVTANGGQDASGIGGGWNGSSSNIKVATALTVYADNTNPPITEILHANDYNIAPNLAGKRYAVVKDDMTGVKEAAIAAINAAIEGVTNEDIIDIATNAIAAINAATSVEVVNAIKTQALADIASAKAACNSALDALGTLGTEQSGPAVEVIDQNDKGIILYNPKKVNFIKVQTKLKNKTE